MINRQLATWRKRKRRQAKAEDVCGLGFTLRMKQIASSIYTQTQSSEAALQYLTMVLGRKMHRDAAVVEDWVLETPDEVLLSISVEPVCRRHWRIYKHASIWVAEWKTIAWLRRQTELGLPQTGLELVARYQKLLPASFRQESVLDTRRLCNQGRIRLKCSQRKWCQRFKRRWRVKRGQLSDMDPLTDQQMVDRVLASVRVHYSPRFLKQSCASHLS